MSLPFLMQLLSCCCCTQVAAHRGRLECAKALLRAGADPNYISPAGDLTLFWGIDGGPALIKLLHKFGCDLDAVSPKGWTALSYSKAKGKYGPTEEKGIYPEVCMTWCRCVCMAVLHGSCVPELTYLERATARSSADMRPQKEKASIHRYVYLCGMGVG